MLGKWNCLFSDRMGEALGTISRDEEGLNKILKILGDIYIPSIQVDRTRDR